jgi:hypothetical protein
MTEEERENCEKVAVYLKRISLLGLVVFITIPLFFYFLKISDQITLVFKVSVVVSGLFLILKSYHLYFDAQLFQKLASGSMGLKDVDELILKLFNKKIQNKDLEDRITGSYQLVRGFVVLFIIHLLCFGVVFWILSK